MGCESALGHCDLYLDLPIVTKPISSQTVGKSKNNEVDTLGIYL